MRFGDSRDTKFFPQSHAQPELTSKPGTDMCIAKCTLLSPKDFFILREIGMNPLYPPTHGSIHLLSVWA